MEEIIKLLPKMNEIIEFNEPIIFGKIYFSIFILLENLNEI